MGNSKTEIKGIGLCLAGVIVARAAFFSINPFAVGFFAAAYIEKKYRFLLFAGMLAGISTAMAPVAALKYGLLLAVISIVFTFIEKRVGSLPPFLSGATASAASLLFSLPSLVTEKEAGALVAAAVMEAVLVMALIHLFYIGIHFFMREKKGQVPGNEELISYSILAGVILYGLPAFPVQAFSVTECAAYLFILFMGYRYGAGGGAISGACIGAALGVAMQNPGAIGIFCILGVCAGMFREIGRIPTGIVYIVFSVVLSFFYEPALLGPDKVRGLVSAAVIFCLLPGGMIYRVYAGGHGKNRDALVMENLENVTKRRLKEFSDSFHRLSRTFLTLSDTKEALSRKDIDGILDTLTDRLCTGCTKCGRCVIRERKENYQASAQIFQAAKNRGNILAEDFPSGFSDKCIQFDMFLEETNRELAVASINLSWQNRMAESREAVADQLEEVADMIKTFTNSLCEGKDVNPALGATIVRAMKTHHIDVRDISIVENRNKKQEIFLELKTKRGRCITTREAAAMVSRFFGKTMRPAGESKNIITKDYTKIVLTEDTEFKVLTGMAKRSRKGENISGDNFSFLNLDNGEMVMMLSDGMGFGENACEESSTVIELLEQFIEAGFSEKSAIRLINSILVLKSNQQTFSTLDMSIIDLYTGVCRFIKIGAAATFIKRADRVDCIKASTLPVGIFNRLDLEDIEDRMNDGDFIIMVSDGILDSIKDENPENYLKEQIMSISSKKPQQISDMILEAALLENDDAVIDDMMVLTAGFWSKS